MRSSFWGLLFSSMVLISCQEENPYKDQYRSQTLSSSEPSSDNRTVENAERILEEDANTVADEDAIAEEQLTAVQLICQDEENATKFPVETGTLCLNGQASNVLANALANPYKGGDNPQLGIIKSEDVNGVSHFILVSSLELPKPLTTVYAERARLNPISFTEGNATVTQVELASYPPQGGRQLGGFDLQYDLRVRVAIITVEDRRILQRDFLALDDEQSVISSASYLKPGAGNNPNSVANLLTYWIADGDATKVITVTHQQADNRGQHQTAENTILAIGRRTMIDTYNLFAQ